MWKGKVVDLDTHPHNKPIPLGPHVPDNWNSKDIVLAHALDSSCIGLVKEEDQPTGWKLAPAIDKVAVWYVGESWYVQLSNSLFRFYSLIQPEVEVVVTTSPHAKSVLLHPRWRDLSVIPQ